MILILILNSHWAIHGRSITGRAATRSVLLQPLSIIACQERFKQLSVIIGPHHLARRAVQLWAIPVNPWAKVNTMYLWCGGLKSGSSSISSQPSLFLCLCPSCCHYSAYSPRRQKPIPQLWKKKNVSSYAGRQTGGSAKDLSPLELLCYGISDKLSLLTSRKRKTVASQIQ